ncbi:MAG: hypothetical protein RDV48_19555 [Candidatus Eremiobacteraeota bacterium]|nr:hypothetical protein [Candidatus Eremiobacteraeota bacterium]
MESKAEAKMDSKRIVGVVMLCAACLFGILISTAFFSVQEADEIPYWWKGYRITGTITELARDHIKIRIENGKEMDFEINAHTKVSLMGRIQLDKGVLVRITYKAIKDEKVPSLARWIRELPSQSEPAGTSSLPKAPASPTSSASPAQTSPESSVPITAPAATPITAPAATPAAAPAAAPTSATAPVSTPAAPSEPGDEKAP